MALGQKARPMASSMMRTSTRKPIRSIIMRILLLWLAITVLLGLPFLELTQVFSSYASPAQAAAPELYFGLTYTGTPDIATLGTDETQLGKRVSLVLLYQHWEQYNQMDPFPTAQMQTVREHGSIPVLSWEPDDLDPSLNQPAFSLARIAGGAWDSYIRQYAIAAKAWGHPFFMGFAFEMNGNWEPWSEFNSGNGAGQFVKAWRHVHDIFTSVGATNATWVWCPNAETAATTPLEDLYPGNAYVDWAGMDGYNFSVDESNKPWLSFSQIFSETYHHLLKMIPASMPIMIGETGSVEDGGSKPAWLADALTTQLPSHFPRIKGLIWFNETIGATVDLRIDSSPQSLAAFQRAIASATYQSNHYSTLNQSPIRAPEDVVLPPPLTPLVIQFALLVLLVIIVLNSLFRRRAPRKRRQQRVERVGAHPTRMRYG
jgi:hypothetical protein